MLIFLFFRTGRIWKRGKKSLAGETDVVVRFQARFLNLAAAFSESGCGVFRMLPRRFPNVSVTSSSRAGRFVNVAVAFSNLNSSQRPIIPIQTFSSRRCCGSGVAELTRPRNSMVHCQSQALGVSFSCYSGRASIEEPRFARHLFRDSDQQDAQEP